MSVKYSPIFIMILLLLSGIKAIAAEIRVANGKELEAAIAAAKPGDRIIMRDGIWKDTTIRFNATGTEKDSIVLEAQTAGKVILSGNSSLKLSGTYLVARGLSFKDGYSKYVITFSDKEKTALHSRVTNCAITDYNPSLKTETNHWIELWGKNNRVDHCSISGKTNEGCTLVVWLKGVENHENYHRIDHNYFGERPPLGSNGGETIRIGTSHNSMFRSNTIVEWNTFEKCSGEVEIISNKSCNNTYRNNLFLESQGSMVFRHGNDCLVENNIFMGNNKPYTGGVRIINEGHTVRNNYFMGLTGQDFRGPLVLMNGVPNSPLNRYNQVKNATVTRNVFYNCSAFQLGAGSDEERTLPPITSVLSDNIVYTTTAIAPMVVYTDSKGIDFKNNILDSPYSKSINGFTAKKLKWKNQNGIFVPQGHDGIDFNIFQAVLKTVTGTNWEVKDKSTYRTKEVVIPVAPGVGTLEKALKKAKGPTRLVLAAGQYSIQEPLAINGTVTISGSTAKSPPILSYEAKIKNDGPMIRMETGARLQLEAITIEGKQNPALRYVISSPVENTPGSYSIFMNKVQVSGFRNTGSAIFKAEKGTFADTLQITNSRFTDNNIGLELAAEKEDKGTYNAENVILKNTVFANFNRSVLDYYRGGNDESTVGGNLVVDHCVFTKIGTQKEDQVIASTGIVNVRITNSVFTENKNIPLQLKGKNNTLTHSVFFNSGTVKTSTNAVVSELQFDQPQYDDTANFTLSKTSPLKNAGSDGKNIGIIDPKNE